MKSRQWNVDIYIGDGDWKHTMCSEVLNARSVSGFHRNDRIADAQVRHEYAVAYGVEERFVTVERINDEV